jgi:serine/threonine-protein kinase HipA
MNNLTSLKVFYQKRQVGTLALLKSGLVAFQYSPEWLREGFSISPFSLPLESKVFLPKDMTFDGLFGVFADSLPDSWGELLFQRFLQKKGIPLRSLNVLDRLAFLGPDSLGGLTYEPAYEKEREASAFPLDEIRDSFHAVLEGKTADLDRVYRWGGSSGGTRPKAHLLIGKDEWLVKFPLTTDDRNVGKMEYDYNRCAEKCGLQIPDFRLFPSKNSPGYFGEKRFDRQGSERIHVLTLSGLLEVSPDIPSLDYLAFLKVTRFLCRSDEEIFQAFRILCFNVEAGNVDDHSKNFSFSYDREEKRYRLSPSYDLTGNGVLKEHEMTVNGNGNPTEEDILALAEKVGIPSEKAEKELLRIRKEVHKDLSVYLRKRK